MGRQMVERRLKTLRRLFHLLPAEVWSILKNSDAYFPFFPSYQYLLLRDDVLYYHRFRRQNIADGQKLYDANSISPRRGVVDLYFQRRQFSTG